MATIHQKFTGDAAQLEKEIEKLRKDYIKLQEQMGKAAKDSKGFAGMTIAAAKSQASAVQGLITQYFALSNIIQRVTAEQQHQQEIANRVFGTNQSVAASQAGMIRNLGPTATKQDVKEMLEAARQIAEETGVKQQDVFTAQGTVLSGSAGNRNLTNQIVREAAKILRDSPQEMAEFAQRVPGVMEAMGTDDPQKAMAWMTSLMGTARLVKPEAFKHYSKAIASGAVVQQGVGEEEATSATGAILSAIGTRLDDAEGAITASAELRLANVMEKVVPERISTLERIKKVQASDKLQKAAIKLFGKENEAYPVVREILTDKQSTASQLMFSAAASLRSSKTDFDNLKSNLKEGSEQLKLAERASLWDTKLQGFDLNSAAGWDAHARSVFSRTIGDTPSFMGITRETAQLAYNNPVDILGRLRAREKLGYSANIDAGIEALQQRRSSYEGQLDITAKLDAAITELQNANEQRRRLLEEAKNTTANTQRAAQVPSAAQRNVHQEAD